jgi:hypothetical protein
MHTYILCILSGRIHACSAHGDNGHAAELGEAFPSKQVRVALIENKIRDRKQEEVAKHCVCVSVLGLYAKCLLCTCSRSAIGDGNLRERLRELVNTGKIEELEVMRQDPMCQALTVCIYVTQLKHQYFCMHCFVCLCICVCVCVCVCLSICTHFAGIC